MSIYADYQRDRMGWLLGLTGTQAAVLGLSILPTFYYISKFEVLPIMACFLAWLALCVVLVIPVMGRSLAGWLNASIMFSIGTIFGWTTFRSRATRGQVTDPQQADLPGRLSGIEVLDGHPTGTEQTRIGIIKDSAAKTWAVTAAITHPGIGMLENDERNRMGRGQAQVLEHAARTGLIDEVVFISRTVPDDGAERALWVQRHEVSEDSHARRINRDLAAVLTSASVRTEQFVTLIVPESNIAKLARQAGGGLKGRSKILYSLMGEMEAQLKAGMGVTTVAWLPSPELATAVRTGFAPGARAGIVEALALQATNPEVAATLPWGHAGPSGAHTSARYYAHDAWWSVASTITLPEDGAAMGALGGVLMPSEPGERRSFMVSYPILDQAAGRRQASGQQWRTDIAEGVREKAKKRASAKTMMEEEKAKNLDSRLARGRTLVRPYAVACVTVPQTMSIADFGRQLDAAIRVAGFDPLRLDLSQDVGFCAANIPLGLGLTRSISGGFAAMFEGAQK